MTKRQFEVLEFVRTFIATDGVSPTYGEIAAHFGFRSLGTVFEHIAHLEEAGYLQRDPGVTRAIRLTTTDRLAVTAAVEQRVLECAPNGFIRFGGYMPLPVECVLETLRKGGNP